MVPAGSRSGLAGMAQVTISAFPTLKRVNQETASPTPQPRPGGGWVAFGRQRCVPGLPRQPGLLSDLAVSGQVGPAICAEVL